MNDSCGGRSRNSVSLLALGRLVGLTALASVAWAGAAQAHKLKAFATAEGALVSGYAYFTPGGRAQQADVTITGPGGVEVLKTGVDAQGDFHFVAKQRVDYVITVDGGDSHIANYTIHAADLPDNLPLPQGGQIAPLDAPTALAPVAEAAPTSEPAAASSCGAAALDPATLRTVVRESVEREVNPLREQLDAFQEAVGVRDVVSGLGYIFGLCGVAYGFMAWRKNSQPASPPSARGALQKGN